MRQGNILSEDKKFVIPMKEYSLFNYFFFARDYYSYFKRWKFSVGSPCIGVGFPAKTYVDYEVSEIKKLYPNKWTIPTNSHYRFWRDGKQVHFKDL